MKSIINYTEKNLNDGHIADRKYGFCLSHSIVIHSIQTFYLHFQMQFDILFFSLNLNKFLFLLSDL